MNSSLTSLGGICIPVEHYGLWGGGMPKAAYLLAHEIRTLGLAVSVLTLNTTAEDVLASQKMGIQVRVTPWRWGHRWGLPQISIGFNTLAQFLLRPDWMILAIGTDSLAGFLLTSPLANRVVVWECTEATRDNPFVSSRARDRLGRALAVLAPSYVIEGNLRRNYGYTGTVLRLPFWVEPPPQYLDEEAGESEFIYLGRKDPQKGLFDLLGALARLNGTGASARLLICGTGEDQPYRDYATKLGIGQDVRFQYFPDQRDVSKALCAARWLVLPSHHEGYPLTLLEAFGQGRPVIATQVGSVPEMCEGSSAALLIPPRDESALAAAMALALDMPEADYRARQATARALFDRLSGPEVVRQRVGDVLGQLVALRQGRGN